MSATVIIGSQWGDEGKGKITDILAEKCDYVVRYQGGNNAGHTVVVGNDTFKLHLLPSGVIHKKKCMIANGVVLDPRALINEINDMESKNITVDLVIDPLTTLIFPYHNILDGISEDTLKDKKIGTTKKGIGPAYEDRIGRRSIRFIDLLDRDLFNKKLHTAFEIKKKIIEKVYEQRFSLVENEVFEEYFALGQKLKKYMGDVSLLVSKGVKTKNILFESAQGTFLDIAYGTYPFVTSSHPIAGSVFANVGFAAQNLNVVAVVKAYTTRVGEGPFLCELNDLLGEQMRKAGHEYGTTTGRPRRCGWLDLVMLKYSNRLNGFSSIAITKLDVLSGLDKIKVAISYTLDGKEVDYPLTIEQLERCSVTYKEFDGFSIDTSIKNYSHLPIEARDYLEFIEKYLDVPISMVSIGPEREATIIKNEIK
ncbi:MAG: adenylosuccinate synthase [archaeon]